MTLLVTGASGFVGSEVVAAAHAAGHRVRALVRASSNTRKLDSVINTLIGGEGRVRGRPGVELRLGDVTDRDAVRAAMAGTEAVIHVAGVSRPPTRRRSRA